MPILCSPVSSLPSTHRSGARLAGACALAFALALSVASAHAQFNGNTGNDLTSQNSTDVSDINANSANTDSGQTSSATTRLRQTNPSRNNNGQNDQGQSRDPFYRKAPYQPNEFERYVQRRANELQNQGRTQDADLEQNQSQNQDRDGSDGVRSNTGSSSDTRATRSSGPAQVRRFGANLVTDESSYVSQDPLPVVPGDYVVRPGDELQLTIWGTVDGDLRLSVDRSGSVTVPRVGAIHVAGLRSADLDEAISRRVGQTFKNFQVSATLGQVRAIRVFVGGYVQRPGSVTVSGLSSILHTIMRAGGPSASGSFRDIHLRRAGREVAVFDLYDLLLKGNRDTDALVQPDDVIFVGPIGTQVAVLGSVNQQAIYELKPGETLADVLGMSGGFNAVGDRARVSLERLADRNTGRVVELALPTHLHDTLASGDIVHAFSVITASLPQEVQNQHVRVEGEVAHPGDYILPPGSHVSDALRAAGGMTGSAYPYGTEFSRESVRQQQQVNYERALRDLETDMSKNQASQRVTSSEELAAQNATASANARLLNRLRQVRPTGRVVLQIAPDAKGLPDLALEDGDTLNIPNRGSSVGIFGSVFNTGSFVFEPDHTTGQYLALAGGPTRGADKDSIFMLRANGSVISARQGASFWHSGNEFGNAVVQPGDTIFVPEQVNKSTFVQDAKDWTQILYQFGLGLAGIKSLGL
ncbi:MAG: SLBB domain-containing protein [Pseudomonadota bacterium]|nr:SLBB domain-containing protein [Pseudomonadota bacterium]